MSKPQLHATHSAVNTRLKRARGHLQSVIGMIEEEKPCLEIAQQLKAVEKAISAAKRALIHDHIDHRLGLEGEKDLAEMRAMAKLL